ncbi:cytochrome b5 domain-containing protein 1 [Bombyx mori]|uniref:Cytochrome b5 domain-containing protein 1 n=1 Tax=Bombyx mori TaxID=7091 RepID=A0A8R2AN43_BOMMO|nr:cytochrome b5 domain-containing protein 1 [Bombyx mori]
MKYTKQEWYTPAEVAVHNKATDCWVSINGKVLDLTSWLQDEFRVCKCIKACSCKIKNWYCEDDCVETCPCFKRGFPYCDRKRRAMTILAYAGKDLSHWFKGDEWIQYTHPIVGCTTAYQRHGHSHQQPVVPSTRWRPLTKPWWQDESLVVGKVTAKTRPIRITNSLTGSTVTLEVCSEETIYQIMMRYLRHNSHMMSYTWRYLGRSIKYNKTLSENGIPDEREKFSNVALPENFYIPALMIYYDDDLTEDPPKDFFRNERHDENCKCKDKDCSQAFELCNQ